MSKNLLITGATGQQGGSTIKALLASPQASDFTIFAVTRNAESGSAKKLQERGVRIVQGDMNDVPAIFREAEKVAGKIWGVYSIQSPMGQGQTVKTEEKQGKDLVDAARKHGVKHFVYSSVDRGGEENSYDNPTPVSHFASKHRIEHYLVENAGDNMGWTILRPAAFMDNLQPGFMGKLFPTSWKIALSRPLQMIAVSDIGYFAAQAFIHPGQHNHRGIGLAGDELTYEQADRIFREKTGNGLPLTYQIIARLILKLITDVGNMYKWFETDGYGIDVKKLREEYPGLLTFGAFIEKQGKFELKKDV